MIRIHSGIYRGQTIRRVGIQTTKETASMVREAVFNSLYNIYGNVLDLFAGSGSYGITALSLGAENATFCDNNYKAFSTIKNNLDKLKINGNVYKTNYISFLKSNEEKFDLIFLDPPYDFKNYEKLVISCANHLETDGRIVLETDKRTNVNNSEIKLEVVKEAIYGSKKIIIYRNN